jgi:hypothetical protein
MRYISYDSKYDEKISKIELKPFDKIELISTRSAKKKDRKGTLGDELVEGCKLSEKAFIILDDEDEVHGVFGLNKMEHIGIPWLLCDAKVCTKAKQLMRESKAIIDHFLSKVSVLTNLVHKDNEDSIRFLRHLGFDFCDKLVRMRRESFVQFYKYNENIDSKDKIFEN